MAGMDKENTRDIADVIDDTFVPPDTDGQFAGRNKGPVALPSYDAAAIHDTPSKWATHAFNVFNVVAGCCTVAFGKQMLNPANFKAPAATDLSSLPNWQPGRSPQAYQAQAMFNRLLFDTGVLMIASGTWFGVNYGLRAVRGVEDAANAAVAGGLSASVLGAAFFETFRPRRVGLWGAVGAALGYITVEQRDIMKAHLLKRQKELEMKYLHVAPDKVHQELQPHLLRDLLQQEQASRMNQVRNHLEQQGIDTGRPRSTQHTGDASSSSSSGGQEDGPAVLYFDDSSSTLGEGGVTESYRDGSSGDRSPQSSTQKWGSLIDRPPWGPGEGAADGSSRTGGR